MRHVRLLLGGIALACVPSISYAQAASVERAITQHVDRNNPSAVALLERLVNINSGTMNFAGVRDVGRIIGAELDALGFATQWIDGASFDRAGHLVAERNGAGPRLLLIGHLDTVFEPNSPFQRYVLGPDSIAKGPGIADMKGGDVIILFALRALHEAGVLDDMNVTVIMTGDEEKTGSPINASRASLRAAADAADIAIGFENGDNNPTTGVVARRGSTSWELRVVGKPSHSSQVFREDIGAGAIFEAARILTRFYERLAGEQFLTFNPGTIVGGTTVTFDSEQAQGQAFGKTNVVAEHAVVAGDLRAVSPEQLATAKERMRLAASESLPHTSAQISFRDSYPPMAPTAGNERLLSILSDVSRDYGFGPMTGVDPRSAGAADISFTAGRVVMGIDGLGLTGDHDHTVDEYADLKILHSQTKKAAILLYRLTTMGAM